MTLPVSGTISMSQVSVELAKAANSQRRLGETGVRTLANKPSGNIKMSDLHGKSNTQYVTQTVALGSSQITQFGGWNTYAGYLIGSFFIGNSGSTTFDYSGDVIVPAGSYISYQDQATATYSFAPSTAALSQQLKLTVRYGTGSWSTVSTFKLYAQGGTLLDTVNGGGDSGYGNGAVITRVIYVTVAPGQTPAYYATCHSTWQGDYNYRDCFESLIDLKLEFNAWV